MKALFVYCTYYDLVPTSYLLFMDARSTLKLCRREKSEGIPPLCLFWFAFLLSVYGEPGPLVHTYTHTHTHTHTLTLTLTLTHTHTHTPTHTHTNTHTHTHTHVIAGQRDGPYPGFLTGKVVNQSPGHANLNKFC